MVSVCIATYNGEKYVSQQVNSILSQLGMEDELVVSDDGSTDHTVDIIESINDGRIRIFRNRGQHGFIHNFENSLKHADGDFVFISDQDDIWKPNKLQVSMRYLQKYDMILHDAELIDQDGLSLHKHYSEFLHKRKGFWANMWKTRWLGCCMAFRRNVLECALPFPQHIVGHDGWISFIGLACFSYIYIPDVLIEYRRHGENVSSASEASKNSWYYKLVKKRLWTSIEVFRRVLELQFYRFRHIQ